MLTPIVINNITNQARRASSAYKMQKADTDDLIQDCVEAVLIALPKFDETRAALGTFVYQKTHYTIVNWLRTRQYSLLPLSEWHGRELGRMRATDRALAQELGREPTSQELADKLGISLDLYHATLVRSGGLLEDVNYREGDPLLEDVIPWEDTMDGTAAFPGPEQHELLTEAWAAIEEHLSGILPIEKDLLARNYGLENYEPQTTREISAELDIPRTTISRHIHRGLAKLRSRLRDIDPGTLLAQTERTNV